MNLLPPAASPGRGGAAQALEVRHTLAYTEACEANGAHVASKIIGALQDLSPTLDLRVGGELP